MEKLKEFSVMIYSELEKQNDVISKARCRVFYKYGNRNAVFITDEFAEKLIKTFPYTPIKGIYDTEIEDFLDHGSERGMGKVYGVVPENPNFKWEMHFDEDGVEREYACVDVYLFTGLYEEAREIVGKAQSMELYPPSMQGNWKIIKGTKYYVLEEGQFLGLQTLGGSVEPCFEGAEFYSFYNDLKEMLQVLEEKAEVFQNNKKLGGQRMSELNFRLSDDQKARAIHELLNTNEANEYRYYLEVVYDSYAIAYDIAENKYVRAYYLKDDETDTIELANIEDCFMIDVTEGEMKSLETLRKVSGTYEKLDEVFEELNEQKSTLEDEKSVLEEDKSVLESEKLALEEEKAEWVADKTELETDKLALETEGTALKVELAQLNEFKLAVEMKYKEEALSKYESILSKETVLEYQEKLESYTLHDLEKDLAYEYVQGTPSVFSGVEPYTVNPIPKNDLPKSGIEALVEKYKK